MAVTAVADAERAPDITIDYTDGRQTFGKPISAHQTARFELAKMAIDVRIARVYVDDCIRRQTAGELPDAEAAGAN
jgi:alkylation response protein AidB-like acyl-CoA dehydrogenase